MILSLFISALHIEWKYIYSTWFLLYFTDPFYMKYKKKCEKRKLLEVVIYLFFPIQPPTFFLLYEGMLIFNIQTLQPSRVVSARRWENLKEKFWKIEKREENYAIAKWIAVAGEWERELLVFSCSGIFASS